MSDVENFILCSAVLHERVYMATRVLEVLISNASRPIRIAELSDCTGYLPKELRGICASLQESALLKRDPFDADGWRLACHPSQITLEDVFQSVAAKVTAPRARSGTRTSGDAERNPCVEILLMQATLAVNQGMRKQLRRFSLDRLKSYPAPSLQCTSLTRKQGLK